MCPWAQLSDAATIRHLCRLEDRAALMTESIGADGMTLAEPIVSPRGDVVGQRSYAHPLVVQLGKVEALIVNLRGKLALDPNARVRLGIAAVDLQSKDSDFKQLLRRRGASNA